MACVSNAAEKVFYGQKVTVSKVNKEMYTRVSDTVVAGGSLKLRFLF